MTYEVRFREEHQKWSTQSGALEIIIDGELVEEYYDGGEPEDNSYHRDWNWVCFELRRAYEKGLEDGKKQ